MVRVTEGSKTQPGGEKGAVYQGILRAYVVIKHYCACSGRLHPLEICQPLST